jgi:hypothetical protein
MLMLVTAGVVLSANMVARNIDSQRNSVSDAAFMDAIVAGLLNYAKRNSRLPCPDVNGDGLEDAADGICSAAASASGGVPYLTLEMTGVGPLDNGIARNFVYGVYRGDADPAKDLTVNTERTVPPHVAPHPSYRNVDDFKQALINAFSASQTVSPSSLYVTGNDYNSGASDCTNNRVANVAFVVAYAGDRNADATGGIFDGAHLAAANWPTDKKWDSIASNTCFVGPGKPISATYDDKVRAVSFLELIGVLSQ